MGRAYMPVAKEVGWRTPLCLFARLNEQHQFNLDVAADQANALCERYFDLQADGLQQSWAGARVWCNPPYGRGIRAWVSKASEEASRAQRIVMLIPARTDTVWWHEAARCARAEFIKGRLKFQGATASAPFPSALLMWNC